MNKPFGKDLNVTLKSEVASSFNELFHTFYAPLCIFCEGYIHDMDLARSLVQQVFVDLWIKRDEIKIKQSIKAYLFTMVKNKAIDHLRILINTTSITEESQLNKTIPFKDLAHEAELNNQLNELINQLPPKCKEIFLLARIDGLKYKEIAHHLNISVKTVEMQMGIALKKIRSEIAKNKHFGVILSIFSKK